MLDCLNNAVFGNKRCELHFLDIEGVYVLLDLIENCEVSLKRLTLSSLCTILENNKSFQYFVEWNSSKTTINATQLLIQLYQSEDLRYGVNYHGGILADTERPLLPKQSYLKAKYGDGTAAENAATANQSIHEMSVMGRGEDGAMKMSQAASVKSFRSIISNPIEQAISLAGSKASKT